MLTTIENLSPSARSLLDTALAGESDAVKARVLQLVLDSGINPEEEFFLISLGLNQLKILLCDGPQQWKQWSDTLESHLERWAADYGQTLELIAQKAEVTGTLSETAAQLATMLTSHTQTCNALVKQFQVSHQTGGDSWESQAVVNQEIQGSLQSLSKQLEQQTKLMQSQLNALVKEVKIANRPDPLSALGLRKGDGWRQAVFFVTASCLTMGAMAMVLMAVFYIQDRPLIGATASKVEYLLQKQNRRDCLDGIKAADSLECQK